MKRAFPVFTAFALLALGGGCTGGPVTTGQELAAFRKAGPLVPQVDRSKLLLARQETDVYKPVPGDVLSIYMPQVLATVKGGFPKPKEQAGTHTARVQPDGTINMPLIGAVQIEGKTVPEVERALVSAYHPDLVKTAPSILVNVQEYRTRRVTVVGAVSKPGMYHLRSTEMSLVAALMKAGGIGQGAARAVEIKRQVKTEDQEAAEGETAPAETRPTGPATADARIPGSSKDAATQPAGETTRPAVEMTEADADGLRTKSILLPVKNLNQPFADVRLQAGDRILVKSAQRQAVSVIGLVKRPTTFKMSPEERVTVLQALARAGGLNDIADPKNATVYRRDNDGEIVAARLRVKTHPTRIPEGAKVKLKPGDVVAVEGNAGTTTRLLLSRIINAGVGVGVNYNPLDDDDRD